MRGALKIIKWGLLGLLLLVASWVAFNGPWADAPVRPRPELLLERPLQVGQPSAYALLFDESIHDVMPAAAPGQCGPVHVDCTSIWLEQSAALRAQLKAAGVLAVACEAATAEGMDWTEPARKLPDINPAAAPIPNFKNVTNCLRWMRAQATLAVVDHDDARALAYLRRSDRAVRAALERAQTLIGHAIAWSMATYQWQTVATLARVRPQLTDSVLELLRPLDRAAMTSVRWISSESLVSQAILRDLFRACQAVRAGKEPARDWLDHLWCQARTGLLPQLTSQEMDSYFAELAALSRGSAVNAMANGGQVAEPAQSLWAWRNTIGHILAVTARPAWTAYFGRQADVELVRQAALLAVQLGRLRTAERAAWLQSQTMQAGLRERIRLDGSALIVRGWSEGSDAIRIPLASG